MSANAKTNQNPTTVQPLISINTCCMGTFEILILCAWIGGRCMRRTRWWFQDLGVGSSLGEAADTMVGFSFWALYSTFTWISDILRLYLVYYMCNGFLCTRATMSLFWLKPTELVFHCLWKVFPAHPSSAGVWWMRLRELIMLQS